MDYKKLNDNEIIELCKEKGIEYYNSKTKKNFAKSTLISRLNKITPEIEVEPKEEIKEEEPIIEYKNEVIWTLSDEDKKNNDDYKEIESKLLNCIKSCHDYLYSNGSICGLKASNDIIRIIILRLFNIIYKNDDIKIEIRNKISVEKLDKYEPYLIDIKEFNKSLNIDNDIKLFIKNIIIPIFPNIFDGDDIIFNMRNYPKNYTTIITKISELIDINNFELFIKLFADTGGNIYEYFTNSYGKGSTSKELGQFFTPYKLINILLINIKDYIDDGYSLYDPCCGSGGLLNRTSSNLGINKDNIYGCEIEKDTIKYALASLLVNNNSFKINIINKCSLSNNNFLFSNKKFNLILTNPPFGIKMTYKDLKSKFEEYRDHNFKSSLIKFEDIYPINTNNGPSLFLQHVIYMLEDNGICGIVLPDGSELSNKSYYNMRKYLIDNCKIIKVINVSGGAFNSTGVKTKILIFKKQKGIDNHKNIEFLEINKDCNEVKLIAIADLDKNYSFKLKINQEIIKYGDDIIIKTLGEICDISYGTRIVKNNNTNGKYPVYGSGRAMFYTNTFNREGYNILIGRFALSLECVRIINDKIFLNDSGLSIKSKIPILLDKYLGYYLLNNQNNIYDLATGTAQKNLNIEDFNLIKIPIPPIEKQEELIKRIDTFENSNKDINNLINNLKEFNKIKLESLINKDIEFIEFGKMFDLIKGSIQSSKVVEDPDGDGVFINWSIYNKYKKISNNILDGNNLFISTKMPNGKDKGYMVITFISGKCNYCDLMSLCKIKEDYIDKINIKYIYYYLLEKQEYIEENYQKGCANKSLDIEEFNLMKIPIPSIEVQEDIIEYCDNNLKIIENLNKTIEGNKKIIKDIITSI
jgi:type I restriction-modification system DNA methylase subunit